MELEALKSRFTEALGSTKLQLSERTLDGMLQDALAEIGDDDSRVTDSFIERKVNLAKTLDGQVNHDVATRIEDYKKKNPPKADPKEKHVEETGEPNWFKAYREKQDAKFAELENARKAEKAEMAKKDIVSQVTKSLEAKFKEAGIEKNSFILKQTLRDIDIPTEGADVKQITKDMEKAYYANLKEAGLNTDAPHKGYRGGDKGKTSVDDYFAKKAKKEGWGNKG